MSMMQILRRWNRYRKTNQFKDKAYKYAMIAVFINIAYFSYRFVQVAPNYGKKGVEVD